MLDGMHERDELDEPDEMRGIEMNCSCGKCAGARENPKPTHCNHCGCMLSTDGTCPKEHLIREVDG